MCLLGVLVRLRFIGFKRVLEVQIIQTMLTNFLSYEPKSRSTPQRQTLLLSPLPVLLRLPLILLQTQPAITSIYQYSSGAQNCLVVFAGETSTHTKAHGAFERTLHDVRSESCYDPRS